MKDLKMLEMEVKEVIKKRERARSFLLMRLDSISWSMLAVLLCKDYPMTMRDKENLLLEIGKRR